MTLRLQHVTFDPLDSDPALEGGLLWFRSDLNQLRCTVDGATPLILNVGSHGNGSVLDHNDVTDAGSGAIITVTERSNLNTAFSHAGVTGNPHGSNADDIDPTPSRRWVGDGSIGTTELADDAVTTAKLADDAVTAAKIADDAVVEAAIQDGAVATAKIASGAVDASRLANSAVETIKINDLAVTEAKLADAAVAEAKLADNAVTTDKVAAAAVTYAKVQNVTEATVLGRATGAGAGPPAELDAATLRTLLDVETKGTRTKTAEFYVAVRPDETYPQRWRAPEDCTITAFYIEPMKATNASAGGDNTVAATAAGNNLLGAATATLTGGTVHTEVSVGLTGTLAHRDLAKRAEVVMTVAFASDATPAPVDNVPAAEVKITIEWVSR